MITTPVLLPLKNMISIFDSSAPRHHDIGIPADKGNTDNHAGRGVQDNMFVQHTAPSS